MTFGARVLKTGVAVTLALYASTFLHLSPPVIAAIAAVFAMQPSIYRSWRYFWEQIQTNTMGALLAVAALHFFQNAPIAVGLVVILVIMLCLKMKMEDTLGLTLVTVIAVMEAPSGQLDFALNRFLLSCIGIVCAFLVNLLLLPPKPHKQYTEQVHKVFERLSLLLRTLISDEIKETVYQEEKKKLLGQIKGLSDKYNLFEEEHRKLRKPSYSGSRRLVVFKQMLTTLVRGADILDRVEEHYFSSDRPKGTDDRFDHHVERLIKQHEHTLLKFENKLKVDAENAPMDEEENRAFLEKMLQLSAFPSEQAADGEGEKSAMSGVSAVRLRLALVASSIFDYGYQVARLDKLVVQTMKTHSDEAGEGFMRKEKGWWKR
ncbi:aromatic acid exporter family protein [Gorillibacterium sp. CAU 1737]|uniref:FUSC family protein n=1 Tax=Gorillibacterium sp. CAU 1737 TaxID=3140362 RepID=UPI003261B029